MSTPVKPTVPTYVESEYSLSFFQSVIQSFFLTLIAELGDRTFIMLIILTNRTSAFTVLLASVIAEVGMNILAMLMGFGIDLMLYKNIIDYLIGTLIFLLFGLWLLMKNLFSKSGKGVQSFEQELKSLTEKQNNSKINKQKEMEEIKEIKEEDENEELLLGDQIKEERKGYVNIQDGQEESSQLINQQNQQLKQDHKFFDKTWFVAIMSSMAIAECGDRTQFTSMSMAAVFDFKGVFFGSGCALILTCVLGVFLGKYIIRILHEKFLNCILGLILVFYASEILYSKIKGVNMF